MREYGSGYSVVFDIRRAAEGLPPDLRLRMFEELSKFCRKCGKVGKVKSGQRGILVCACGSEWEGRR
jgi:hypothetical protein